MGLPIKFAVLLLGLVVTALACADGGEDSSAPSSTPVSLGASATPGDASGVGDECSSKTYVVKPGDTLSDIALEFDVSVVEIATASGLSNPDKLDIDQELTIPCPVADGVPPPDDTLSPTPSS
ncbi:MAG: LysM peptidoglycan-binding domain-containing protein [Dehalococcoidia bacterium]